MALAFISCTKDSRPKSTTARSRSWSSRWGAPKGRTYHCALESNGEIQVFDTWESQEDFDAFDPL